MFSFCQTCISSISYYCPLFFGDSIYQNIVSVLFHCLYCVIKLLIILLKLLSFHFSHSWLYLFYPSPLYSLLFLSFFISCRVYLLNVVPFFTPHLFSSLFFLPSFILSPVTFPHSFFHPFHTF